MKIYLVGGAVRDQLLGLSVKERDWVVVGASPQEMLKLGFKKVGRDFPVFLHPKTHEEYALARTERKTGRGYTDFICYSDPSVTLEDDLKRRDLTINAIAQSLDGKIIDPYGGCRDLKKHILRHVSPAFAEDPVRILRVARFAARFNDFKVHSETNKLMRAMLAKGEVDALVPERVWQELQRALSEESPERFFMVLKRALVLQKLFPEIAAHFTSIKKALTRGVKLSRDAVVRFAAITYSLSNEEIKNLCKKYKLPSSYKELSLLVNKLKNSLDKLSNNADDCITLLEQIDAYRRPERFRQFLLVCEAGNKKLTKIAEILCLAYQATKKIRLTQETIARVDKKDLHQILHDKRGEQLTHTIKSRNILGA
ncbi:CCA-adding enzyme / 2'-nucleotidase / 2',3'-cyclic phosphodiesterase / Phosphatase [Gammaproteobacteria bacterium]